MMRTTQVLRLGLMLLLAGPITAAVAQLRIPCSEVLESEREFVRRFGGCQDVAPIVDIAPKRTEPAPPVVIPVPNVVGLSFDDARARLTGFDVRRSYRASAEAGGTVLEQQPSPPARAAAGATVRVVLSDATLRPPPRVSAAEVDGVAAPAASADSRARPSAEAVPESTSRPAAPVTRAAVETAPASRVGRVSTTRVEPASAPKAAVAAPEGEPPPATRIERLRLPNVVGMTAGNAEARLSRFSVERRNRASQSPAGRVIQQTPRAASRVAAGSEVVLTVSSGPPTASAAARTAPVEMVELPNVVERSFAAASGALAEFKVERVEVAGAAPSGQVLAQDPAPGSPARPGSTISLRVSDGSLASTAAAASANASSAAAALASVPAPAAPKSTPAPAPVSPAAAIPAPASSTTTPAAGAVSSSAPARVDRPPVTVPRGPTLALIAAVLLGLGLGALWMRRWFFNRHAAGPAFTVDPGDASPHPVDEVIVADVTRPAIAFAARIDAGETAIEFAAAPDADETTLEHSRELHE